MSRIVIDARELRTSSGRYVERLLKYLQTIDTKNEYKILLKPGDIEGWKPISTNFSAVACPFKEYTFDEQIALRKKVEKLKPDLVHFAFAQQPVWYKGKTVTTVHDLTTLRFNNPAKNILIFKFKQAVYGFVIKRSVNKASALITPSQFVKDDLVDYAGIDPSKITVTYEAADLIKDKAEPVLELEKKQFVMYVGRPTPHKNLWKLIEAFAVLKQTHPDLTLALAGKKDFNYAQIEQKVKAKDIKDVVFTDFISEGQLKWMYEHCSAYIFPSLSEGFGLPGLEAMVHGAPVVSSNATCLPEIYGNAAKYFDPNDIDDMVQSISEVLDNTDLRKKLISAGLKRAKDYSWSRMAEQTLAIYKKALN